jgi:hypothetical protein
VALAGTSWNAGGKLGNVRAELRTLPTSAAGCRCSVPVHALTRRLPVAAENSKGRGKDHIRLRVPRHRRRRGPGRGPAADVRAAAPCRRGLHRADRPGGMSRFEDVGANPDIVRGPLSCRAAELLSQSVCCRVNLGTWRRSARHIGGMLPEQQADWVLFGMRHSSCVVSS